MRDHVHIPIIWNVILQVLLYIQNGVYYSQAAITVSPRAYNPILHPGGMGEGGSSYPATVVLYIRHRIASVTP